MTKPQTKRADQRRPHSKAFDAGLEILANEIELALKWRRASILLVVHSSKLREAETQRALQNQISGYGARVQHLRADSVTPDIIRQLCALPVRDNAVFFVEGIGSADELAAGRVSRALNISRELLVENNLRVVFWLDETEVAQLPRRAPDFWAFRHRVVDFAPKRGRGKGRVPAKAVKPAQQVDELLDEQR